MVIAKKEVESRLASVVVPNALHFLDISIAVPGPVALDQLIGRFERELASFKGLMLIRPTGKGAVTSYMASTVRIVLKLDQVTGPVLQEAILAPVQHVPYCRPDSEKPRRADPDIGTVGASRQAL